MLKIVKFCGIVILLLLIFNGFLLMFLWFVWEFFKEIDIVLSIIGFLLEIIVDEIVVDNLLRVLRIFWIVFFFVFVWNKNYKFWCDLSKKFLFYVK